MIIRVVFTLALTLGSICVLSKSVAANTQTTSVDVKVRLNSNVEQICQFEAVPLDVSFKNQGKDAVPVYSLMFVEASGATLKIEKPDGQVIQIERPIWNPSPILHGGRPRKVIKPGDTFTKRVNLCCTWLKNKKLLFGEEGQYTIVVHYQSPFDDEPRWYVESNAIRIEVVKPPKRERDAIKVIRKMNDPGALFEPVWDLQKGPPDALYQLANMKESRIYANYARLVLAKVHIERAASRVAVLDNPLKLKEAREHAQSASKWLDRINANEFTLKRDVEQARKQLKKIEKMLAGRTN